MDENIWKRNFSNGLQIWQSTFQCKHVNNCMKKSLEPALSICYNMCHTHYLCQWSTFTASNHNELKLSLNYWNSPPQLLLKSLFRTLVTKQISMHIKTVSQCAPPPWMGCRITLGYAINYRLDIGPSKHSFVWSITVFEILSVLNFGTRYLVLVQLQSHDIVSTFLNKSW